MIGWLAIWVYQAIEQVYLIKLPVSVFITYWPTILVGKQKKKTTKEYDFIDLLY